MSPLTPPSPRELHQQKEAARYFRLCLKHNPFMWTAFQALCHMAEPVSPEECFSVTQLLTPLKYMTAATPGPKFASPHVTGEGECNQHESQAYRSLLSLCL